MTTSPAAAAVRAAIAAFWSRKGVQDIDHSPVDATIAAAALRAAADAVVPLEIMGGPGFANEPAATAARQRTRRKLLAIADELEAGR